MASITPNDPVIDTFLAHPQTAIIDLRSSQDYQRAHILSSSHFCSDSLLTRMHELPAKGEPLRLVGRGADLALANALLTVKGYPIVAQLIWSEKVLAFFAQQDLLEFNHHSKVLWQPASIVKYFVEQFNNLNPSRRALDIACGAGRDAVYLAMQGWQVQALDYSAEAINKLRQLALHNHVSVMAHEVDLEQDDSVLDQFSDGYDLILVVRYLHRPLLSQLQKKLNPGGYLVYQTFSDGCQAFGKPKNPRFILQKDELARQYSSFIIHHDSIDYLSDGRPTNVFIAQKPVSG